MKQRTSIKGHFQWYCERRGLDPELQGEAVKDAFFESFGMALFCMCQFNLSNDIMTMDLVSTNMMHELEDYGSIKPFWEDDEEKKEV